MILLVEVVGGQAGANSRGHGLELGCQQITTRFSWLCSVLRCILAVQPVTSQMQEPSHDVIAGVSILHAPSNERADVTVQDVESISGLRKRFLNQIVRILDLDVDKLCGDAGVVAQQLGTQEQLEKDLSVCRLSTVSLECVALCSLIGQVLMW